MEPNEKTAGNQDLISKATRLFESIQYQDDSIVSRTILDKSAGTVTLFAFAAGQGLSEHTAPYDALVYIFDGEADITISGITMHLTQGGLTIMPANEPHALKASQKFKMMLVMIKA
jgi:quercetin dioxygenase-like cupin family protein